MINVSIRDINETRGRKQEYRTDIQGTFGPRKDKGVWSLSFLDSRVIY